MNLSELDPEGSKQNRSEKEEVMVGKVKLQERT